MEAIIAVKITYDGENRRFSLDERTYAALKKQIQHILKIEPSQFHNYVIKYQDTEGDMILMSSEQEFSEALFQVTANTLRLFIFENSHPAEQPVVGSVVESGNRSIPEKIETTVNQNVKTTSQTPLVTSAVPQTKDKRIIFKEQIKKLEEMGYPCTNEVLRILTQTNGNFDLTLSILKLPRDY